MPRKKNAKENFKKEIIIKSREIVSKMGFKKASTEEIARSLNRTKGALYHYFENREEILKSVVSYEASQLISALEEAVENEEKPEDKLFAFFYTRANVISTLWEFYRSIIHEYFMRYGFIMKAIGEYTQHEMDTVTTILKAGIKSKAFSVTSIPLTAKAILKAMKGFDFFIFQGEDLDDIQEEVKEALKIIVQGLMHE
jgi:AcrR family transcriptional regulator